MGRCSDVQKPVFVETNLGTRLVAVPVSPYITAMEFKRELERTHLICFPEFGRISVDAVMVKRKSRFYHLSESLPLKYAFPDSNRTWFLRMDARMRIPAIVYVPKRRKRRRRKREIKNQATLDETSSELVSVSGVIEKYFADYDEVASTRFSSARSRHECKYLNGSNAYGHTKPEVGKRLVIASDNLGISPGNQRPALSLCKDNDRESRFCRSSIVVRNLVFEMSEESE